MLAWKKSAEETCGLGWVLAWGRLSLHARLHRAMGRNAHFSLGLVFLLLPLGLYLARHLVLLTAMTCQRGSREGPVGCWGPYRRASRWPGQVSDATQIMAHETH